MADIRILHVVGSLGRGGAESLLMNLMRSIDRDRFQFDFLVEKDAPDGYEEEARSLGATIHKISGHRNLLSYGRTVRNVMRGYDIVHSAVNAYGGFLMLWAHQAGVPVRIAHSQNLPLPDARPTALRRLYMSGMRTLIRFHATHGVACTLEAGRLLFGNRWDKQPACSILPNAIDLTPYQQHHNPVEVRRSLGLPDNAVVVGHVGRFSPQKNHTFLIDIFAELHRLRPEAHLLLAGQGDLRSRAEERVAAHGLQEAVHFLGLRDDVPRLFLGAMDLLLFPSKWEGLPLTVVEAQCAGLPALVSYAVPKQVEIVAGLVVRLPLSNSAKEWAEQALELMNRPGVSKSDALAVVEASHFNVQIAVKQLEKIYDDALNGTRRAAGSSR